MIVLAIGINDSPHEAYAGTKPDEFRKQFEGLVNKALGVTEKVVVVSPTNVLPESSYSDSTIEPYVEIIKEVAANKQLPFVDVFGLMTAEDLAIDGLHPDAGGHQKIFEKVEAVLSVMY